MNMLLANLQAFALLAFIVAVIGLSWLTSRPRNIALNAMANVAEGCWEEGQKSYRTDAAITTRYLLGKIGSDASHIAVAGVNDVPIGIITDEAAAAEDTVNVDLLGAIEGTDITIGSAAINAGDLLVSAANGQVRTLPVTTGTYWIIGRALNTTTTQGDQVQTVPCFPIQRVVP